MKKTILILVGILVLAGVLTGCSRQEDTDTAEKLNIVTTIFPEYDWVREILGEKAEEAEITVLMDSGTDLHNYQPAAEDIVKIDNCDIFIYVGGESDDWVSDALDTIDDEGKRIICLMDVLGDMVKEEQDIEGMQEEEHDHEDEDEDEDDEHVWLSIKNAAVICREICNILAEADPAGKSVYESNSEAYIEELNNLDTMYKSAVESSRYNTIVFGDRFPFRYMMDDYGLSYYAAFSGCSAETEASFETIKFLAEKVDELNLPCVMTIEGTDHKIAETVVNNTIEKNQKVLVMDSLQSTTAEDISNGKTYIEAMRNNLDVLKAALN